MGDTPAASGGPVPPRKGLSLEALRARGPLWAASSLLVTKEQILWDSTCTRHREKAHSERPAVDLTSPQARGGEAGVSSWRWTGVVVSLMALTLKMAKRVAFGLCVLPQRKNVGVTEKKRKVVTSTSSCGVRSSLGRLSAVCARDRVCGLF